MQTNPSGGRRPAALWPLWLLVAACTLPELAFSLADHGLLGVPRLRTMAVQNGAFWPGLLQDWQPNYAGQPEAMFLTYMFLHAGPGHLIGNMAALIWLGLILLPLFGPWRFLALYFATGLIAAGTFALLAPTPAPMVGASGAIFGLAGAWLSAEWRLRPPGRAAWLRLAGLAALVLAAGLATPLFGTSPAAWQAHVGGAAAGLVIGLVAPLPRRNR